MHLKNLFIALVVVAIAPAISLGAKTFASEVPAYIAHAIDDPARPKDDTATDTLRDPADTLEFSGVKPGMVVGELFPGGGYYTRMLSDIVGPRGKVFGLENSGWQEAVKLDEAMAAEPSRANVVVEVEPFGQFKLPPKIDFFWITQNYHDLKIAKYGAVDIADFNDRVFKSLKPGGIYFIIDHQANAGETEADIAALHRIEKAQVIKEVTAAGFKLVAEGEFLHHAADDHSKSVFDPSIRGNTDQFALKFAKP